MKKILLSLVFLLGSLAIILPEVQAQTASSSSFVLTGGDFDSFGIATMSGQTYSLSSDSNSATNWLDRLDNLGVTEDELGNYDSSNFFGNDEGALGYTPESLANLFTVQAMNASGSARPSLQLTVDTQAMALSLLKKNPSLIAVAHAQEATPASVSTQLFVESTVSGVVSTASAQVLLLDAVTPGIFGEAILRAQVTTQGMQNSGYSLYTSATKNFLNAAYLQELVMTGCDAGDCTISQATPWADQKIVGVGYTAYGEDALADFAGGNNFRPFANQNAGETLQSVATNNSTNDQVARQTTLKIRVSVPGNFPAGNYESALNFMALPNL